MNNKNGFALILVMFLVLVLSSISILLTQRFLFSFKQEYFLKSRALTLNNYSFYENKIVAGLESFLKDEKMMKEFDIQNEIVFDFETSSINFPILIRNKSRCFNLNSLFKKENGNLIGDSKQAEILLRLLKELEISPVLGQSFVDQLLDWVDSDDEVRPYGLEDYFYSGPQHEPRQYSSKRLLLHLAELKALPVVNQLDWDLISKYCCVIPSRITDEKIVHPVNINVFNQDDIPLILALLPSFSVNDAMSVIMNIPPKGYSDMKTFKEKNSQYEMQSFFADIFKTRLFETVVNVPFNGKYFEIKTLFYINRSISQRFVNNLKPKVVQREIRVVKNINL